MFLLVVLIGLLFTSCEMGLGPTVDLEPPSLTVTSIVLPDGTEKPIDSEENEKLLIGPWVLVTSGFTLKGETWDNINVDQVLVEEIDKNGVITQQWTGANITERAAGGKQGWSVVLNNINKGERTIRVTAYDRPKNIGPETIKQVTMLVDTAPPFIESIKVERHGGEQVVDLLPQTVLAELDTGNFEHVDYFQNESFAIRAVITHEFSLSEVTLNLIQEDGTPLFADGLEKASGSLYAPVWDITAADIIDVNPVYASGRHYFNVEITARAVAGHTGQNVTTNMLFSLCWYPEADFAKIQFKNNEGKIITNENTNAKKGTALPVKFFDDDNVKAVYAGLIPESTWNSNALGLEQLIEQMKNGGSYTYSNIQNPSTPLLTKPTRNTVIPLEISDNKGIYKLLILVKDANDMRNPGTDKWSGAVYDITVIEEGIPFIKVENPTANTRPVLGNNGKITLDGYITNLEDVKFIIIAWIPDGLSKQGEQMAQWENALREKMQKDEDENYPLGENEEDILDNGIKIWRPPLGNPSSSGGFQEWVFSQDFNVYNDFKYNGATENEPKLFILYTQSAGTAISEGVDVFITHRLLAYNVPPSITLTSPTTFTAGIGDTIAFDIGVTSLQNVNITSVSLVRFLPSAQTIPLTGPVNGAWTGNATVTTVGDYGYRIIAKDELNNEAEQEVYITVKTPPRLTGLSCINPNGAYSGISPKSDTLTFQLTFNEAVYTNGAVTMVITDGANGNTGFGGNQTINFTQIPNQASATFSLTATWNVSQNVILDPLTVSSIDITNVRSVSNESINTSNLATLISTFNTSRGTYSATTPYLKVISRRPDITGMISTTSTANDQVLAPSGSPAQSVLTLTFNQTVWPESGTITVKPYGDWYIPPVLTNDDFNNNVINKLAGTTNATRDTNRLKAAYQRTTHGLVSGSGAPDTSTKYVLDFNTGISGTGTVVAALRTAFNNAEYQWQKIEVRLNSDQIRGANNTALTATKGDTTIQIRLDRLLDGRQWKIEIPEGAFRDEAGNTFAGWITSSDHRFWSQTVATPVIRVNRVSNNMYNTEPATTDNTARTFDFSDNNATVTTTLGTASEQISRYNVEYRIDCETPGSVITRGTLAKSSSAVNTTTTAGNYRPDSSTSSLANSNHADATSGDLTGITATTAYTAGTILTIGNTSADSTYNRLYTARKDYIAATATKAAAATPVSASALTTSARGYEGAFKTIIVYRNVSAGAGYVKYEGTNVYGGATTIPGFPLSNNDMSGKTSKHAYHNNPNGSNGNDWVWISWEIVSDFWHVGLSVNTTAPNSMGGASWHLTNDHQTHSYRKYGNWGLRIGD